VLQPLEKAILIAIDWITRDNYTSTDSDEVANELKATGFELPAGMLYERLFLHLREAGYLGATTTRTGGGRVVHVELTPTDGKLRVRTPIRWRRSTWPLDVFSAQSNSQRHTPVPSALGPTPRRFCSGISPSLSSRTSDSTVVMPCRTLLASFKSASHLTSPAPTRPIRRTG
jgi:hypothetical protein